MNNLNPKTDKTEIKDFLHLYLGCQCVMIDGDMKERKFMLNAYNLNYYRQWLNDLKPILRKLDSMTEEEAKEIWHATGGRYDVTNPKHVFTTLGHENFTSPPEWFAITRLLLSKGFDLFGLIDSGLAIDSHKVKTDTEV